MSFVFGCMPVRLVLLPWFAVRYGNPVPFAVIGATMMLLYVFGLRTHAAESSVPGGRTWWAGHRWVHALAFGAAAWLLRLGHRRAAAAVLVADAVFGFAMRKKIVG